jgi:nucleoside-diphosphate-sugar epimerase
VKVLVTGSTGFLGASLVERLLAHGERDLRCFVRAGSKLGPLDALEKQYPDAKLERFVGTLSSRESAEKALEGVDVVYHLAASLAGAPADMFLNTVVASKNLLEGVAKAGRPIKIVLVSSFGVYGVADLPRGHVVDEQTPLETQPARRDLYSQAKLRQEKLFWEYRERYHFPLVVLRPGVIYGPRGSAFSARVGLKLFGVFLYLGRDNVLPLSYVDNCAEAIVVAGQRDDVDGQVFNVHDDDLPTAGEYLRNYKANVRPVPSITVPYPALKVASRLIERYHAYSKGQLPAIFTPYKTATTWKGNRFDNSKIKSIGWKQIVPTPEAMKRTFAWFKANPK